MPFVNNELDDTTYEHESSTIMLGPVNAEPNRIAHQKERPGAPNQLRQAVPMHRIDWDETQPGHFEVDLVHHCGPSPDGQYIHTLQLVDVATGWSECSPILGRSYRVMEDGFQGIFNRLPFPVLELHPDNGGEFFNRYLIQSWKDQVKGLRLSRSRPYQKNDNRFVEENNFSLVRAYVGHGRLDTVAHTRLLHQLYEQLWLYHNFFQPVMRLKHKINLPGQLRGKRVYDRAQPPFDRLCAKGVLSSEKQRQLHDLREATNPYQLRCSIEKLITQLFQLPKAKEGVTEDVYQTLGLWQPKHLSKAEQTAKRTQ
jgi:hypothetical protein